MPRLTDNKVIIITRKTRLDEVIVRFNTLDQAKFYVESLGADFTDYQIEDQVYKRSVANVEQELQKIARVQVVERAYVPNFIFGKNDIVVVIGQDGLVANTLKYLDSQPVVAINPDPGRWDGVLLPFKAGDASLIVQDIFNIKRQRKEITFAQVETNDGQRMYGVNDLFIGPKSHTSARYLVEVGDKSEQQSSSGIIVSTGLGSTGWLSSILAGARGIARQEHPKTEPAEPYRGFEWDSKGYKMLDSHIGLIYGDSITLERAEAILKGLEAKGFCSGNVVFGVGSYTYQYVTRDNFGFAVKATSGVVNGERRDIFKDPKTDSGMKKSAKGLLRVEHEGSKWLLYEQQSVAQEEQGLLECVFLDGKLKKEFSLAEIRKQVDENL